MDIKDFVTVSQAAKIMKCSRQEVHRRILMGKIKAVKMGKMFLIPKEDLKPWFSPVTPSNLCITIVNGVHHISFGNNPIKPIDNRLTNG
jgi:excisionase family DNA binding protein